MAVCTLLFFAPGLKLAAVGLNLNLPHWLTHILAWTLLIGFTLAHRAGHRRLAREAST